MTPKIVISQYPITKDIRVSLENKLKDEIEFIVISHFAHNGYLNLIQKLRQISCKELYIYTSSDDQHTTMPVLRFMGALIPANLKYVLSDEGASIRWGFRDLLSDFCRVVWSLLAGLFSLVAAVSYLLAIRWRRCPPISFKDAFESKQVLYLRPTLWQGLKEGGAISHSRGVISGFQELGYFVNCFADSKFIKIDDKQGNFHLINPRNAYVVPRELNFFTFQWDFIKQTKILIEESFSGIIYQRLAIGSFAGVVLSRLWQVPLIIEYNGSELWLAKNWGSNFFFERIVSFVEKSILSNAYLVVTVSEPLKKDLESKGISPDHIVVCPNGVDTNTFSSGNVTDQKRKAVRSQLGIADDDLLFTFVGTFGIWHGAVIFADTILQILQEYEETKNPLINKLRFLFIGNGTEYTEVNKRLKSASDNGRVIMTGLVEHSEVIGFLAASDVCVSPTVENQDGSEFFGSPTKLFEYMAASKPVIASAVGQIKEVMQGSPNFQSIENDQKQSLSAEESMHAVGVLVPPGNTDRLKAAILMLANNEQMRNTMGKNAFARVLSAHSWTSHVQQMLMVLSGVLEGTTERNVKLLINALHSKSGGGVTYIRNMVPLFAANEKLDVHVVLQDSQKDLFGDNLVNVSIHFIDTQEGLMKLIFTEQILLPMLARDLGADVVFSPANYGPLATFKSVILLRNSLDVAFVDHRLRKLVYWGLLTVATITSIIMAREVIAVSEYARNSSLRGILANLRKKVSIVPHGISNEFANVSKQEIGENFILTVSDIYVQKNLHTLIQAFAQLVSIRSGLKLKVAGKPIDKDYFQRIVRLIDDLGVTEHVEFLGHVDTDGLKDLYRKCRFFVFPSTVETFGNPLAEAMACGCPIVCSDAAAMPEVAGDAAIYANPNNHQDFFDAMKRMLDDEKLCAEYGAKAKERAKRYSWEITSKNTTEVILRAANLS